MFAIFYTGVTSVICLTGNSWLIVSFFIAYVILLTIFSVVSVRLAIIGAVALTKIGTVALTISDMVVFNGVAIVAFKLV